MFSRAGVPSKPGIGTENMNKRVILAICLCSAAVWSPAQTGRTYPTNPLGYPATPAACTSPTGTVTDSSFGDYTAAYPNFCGFGSYVGCNRQWKNSGGGAAIIATPGSPSADTACNYSLEWVSATAASNYIVRPLPATVSAATQSTTTVGLYLKSSGLGTFKFQTLYTAATVVAGTTYACRLELNTAGSAGVMTARGNGSANVTATITTNAWHTLVMFCDPAGGASASYVTLDGGAQKTFTANAQVFGFEVVGPIQGNQGDMTYDVGYITVN